AVLLRALGYSTRLVSGFYADPQRFDWRARNTPVAKDDVHFWTEVRLAGGVWTPIEPTPGYELLRARPSVVDMAAEAIGALGRWALAHWAALAMVFACGALGLRHRAELADLAATLRWRWSGRGSCRRRVLATLRLLDGRVARARLHRPPAQTPGRWFGRLAAQIAPELGDDVRQWAFVIDWVVHAPPHQASRMPLGNREVNVLCDRLAREWDLRRLRLARAQARPNNGQNSNGGHEP
ncbi:MAG TPA: transglutaminase-like domain-containing protein, partial [Pirellulales bacterium]|nr:transglutaminase-like domain-containing protein [Pirellulales bacterium]